MNNEAAAHYLQSLVDRDADCRCGNKTLSEADIVALITAVRCLLSTSIAGKTKSEAKAIASRLNGAKGGRPRKDK